MDRNVSGFECKCSRTKPVLLFLPCSISLQVLILPFFSYFTLFPSFSLHYIYLEPPLSCCSNKCYYSLLSQFSFPLESTVTFIPGGCCSFLTSFNFFPPSFSSLFLFLHSSISLCFSTSFPPPSSHLR